MLATPLREITRVHGVKGVKGGGRGCVLERGTKLLL